MRAVFALLLLPALSGCLVGRTITDVAAHDTYNNYKVQTLATYYGVLTVWVESEIWTCHKAGGVFRCTELDYDATKAGFKGSGPPVVAPVPAPEPSPAAPAPAPTPAAPPTAAPAPAPTPAPTTAPAPPAPAPAPTPAPTPAAPPTPPPTPSAKPPAPAPTPPPAKKNDLYDGPRH
jgi:hypothetical protein